MTTAAPIIINGQTYENLMPFQVDKIESMVNEFQIFNRLSESHDIEFCPKCGMKNPQFIKGGTKRTGKQMLRCCECGRRFVHDTGSLTFYSHQDSSRWSSFIKSTLEGKSMKKCAEELEVSQKTAFRMRHKLMFFIGEAVPRNILTDQVEVDEKYFAESHKGLIDGKCFEPLTDIFAAKEVEETKSLSSSESARLSSQVASCADRVSKLIFEDEKANKPKKGISHDQVCVMTGIERGGMVEGWATNTAGPTLESAESFLKVVKDESHVWLDGCKAYPSKLEEKKCTYTVVSEETRSKVDHVNNINSFHDYLKDENKAMRGVSSIYINRYTSLWNYKYNNRELGEAEMAMKLLGELGRKQTYFYVRELQSRNIFDDPHIMAKREGRTSVMAAYNTVRYDSRYAGTFYEEIQDSDNESFDDRLTMAVEARCGVSWN